MRQLRPCLTVLALLATVAALQAAPREVFVKTAGGQWRAMPCQYDAARGVISFTLDPRVIGSGSTTVLLSKTPGIVLDDSAPPVVTGLKFDGRPLPVRPVTNLDWLPAHPQTIIIGLADRLNPLDLSSLKMQVNGQLLKADQYQVEPAESHAQAIRLTLPVGALLREQNRFANALSLRVSDQSPEQNTTSFAVMYHCLGEVKDDPTLVVDSSYTGYEDLKVLTDGQVMTPGETTYGCTWASEEKPGDHWLVFAWPQEKTVSGVEVFWASYQGVFHAPHKLLVQTWDGRQWVTQQTLMNLKPIRSTAIPVTPVATTRVRLYQPDGEGHPVRPNIMWITEVALSG